ncbi:MAG TPA: SNF2-related protein [Buttiauxella sp.]|jgi:SNF2 family DNA or RNA helicase
MSDDFEPNKRRAVEAINRATSVGALLSVLHLFTQRRKSAQFGVEKIEGRSLERERKEANAAAVALLRKFSPGDTLTDEERQVLAAYTGEGGIGANEHEYYTPQYVAEGIWDLLAGYGADTGNTLEPASGTGVFHETKPTGVIMTATEISDVSSRINQLLHPEDTVITSPFERLAASTPDGTYDSCVGNVPFGNSRGEFANLDPAYAKESNIGRYFILRLIDKVKAGGMICIVVPFGMTTGATHKKLREQVSRKAEFLGAHRLPSGTFENNGTSTAVDVWVLRKHPEELADRILTEKAPFLKHTNVLWDTFIKGKWFDLDGKRFLHGTVVQGYRMSVQNDQIKPAGIKAKLAQRFDSRILWDEFELVEPMVERYAEGDDRLINDVWYRFENERWVINDARGVSDITEAKYGAASYDELAGQLKDCSATLGKPFDHILAAWQTFPALFDANLSQAMALAQSQPVELRERIFRGSLIGVQIATLQDAQSNKLRPDYIEPLRADVARLVAREVSRFGAATGKVSGIRGNHAKNWLKFAASTDLDGNLSALLKGQLDIGGTITHNTADHVQVVSHLFSQIDLDPITLEAFRQHFTGELPEDDNEALSALAHVEGIAITASGDLMPMDRATSGDISALTSSLNGALAVIDNEAIRQNYLRQLVEVRRRRKWTEVDDLDFNLNARWFDRSLVLEYLTEQGYDKLSYTGDVTVDDNGIMNADRDYHGRQGVFSGYRYGTVVSRDKTNGIMKSSYKRVKQKDAFLEQLENYLNGNKPRGVYAADYMARIKVLEAGFNDWIRQHDEIDNLVQEYNDTFNGHIPFEYSDAPLGLKGISGRVIPAAHQNSAARRASEDGRGILGHGTGTGKTVTMMATEAFNFENGRAKRTATVVPKAVYENWFHEAHNFYSAEALSTMFFVGLDVISDENGQPQRVPVLDDEGKPRVNQHTGEEEYRLNVKLVDGDTVKQRMHLIPQSNYRMVVMTKEQYAKIPMKEETIRDHAYDVLYNAAEAGRVNLDGTKHRDANAKSRILAKASDTGTAKEHDYPYFEDMAFDNVIVDEGHNYRNSYAAGREAGQLAYLPSPSVAQSARDMAVKNAYMLSKNNGRGVLLGTATPAVNSPIDAFNMLSHVMTMEEWGKLGIQTPDDFVKVFGATDTVLVQKLSGEVEEKEGLVGFQNLSGLRGIFHRWVDLKSVKDVSDSVKIPDLEEHTVEAPMTGAQAAIYEELRQRAEALSNQNGPKADAEESRDAHGHLIEKDSIFAIIRDMDRVCTDLDLYRRQMTFRLPAQYETAIRGLAEALPAKTKAVSEDSDETYDVEAQVSIALRGEVIELVVPEDYEGEVMKRLSAFKIDASAVSHPIMPKYSALIEKVKRGYEEGGKQIIFTDEKSQHEKLARILCAELGIDASEIGIINAASVAAAGKGKKKLKAVKPPREPKEDATEAEMEAYYTQKLAYEDYIAQSGELSLTGIESIAADYNEGRKRILICNKKAEVGINLHHGTTDIHHLTLPWTPASIDQRNGRGARTGSKQSKVRVHYYAGKGSFDEFRLSTLKRKKEWITTLFTSDEARMANADASDAADMSLLLAANPEERACRNAEMMEEAKTKAMAAAQKRAGIDLQNYIKASHAAKGDMDTLLADIEKQKQVFERDQARIEEVQNEMAQGQADYDAAMIEVRSESPVGYRYRVDAENAAFRMRNAKESLEKASKSINKAQAVLRKMERKVERQKKSESEIKRLRPTISKAIEAGLIEVPARILDRASEFYISKNGQFSTGETFAYDVARGIQSDAALCRIESIDFDSGIAELSQIYAPGTDRAGANRKVKTHVDNLRKRVTVSESEVSLRQWMMSGVWAKAISERLSKSQFQKYLADGSLTLNDKAIPFYDGDEINVRAGTTSSYSSRTQNIDAGWFKSNSMKIIYPDPTDDVLKTRLANWLREAEPTLTNKLKFAGETFIQAVMGENWKVVMESYGEQASESEIALFISDTLAMMRADDSLAKLISGANERDVIYLIANDRLPEQRGADFGYQARKRIPGRFANKGDFNAAIESMVNQLSAQAIDDCRNAVNQYGLRWMEEFESNLTVIDPGIVERLQRAMQRTESSGYAVVSGYQRTAAKYGEPLASMLNGSRYFADMVFAGLFAKSAVTAKMLATKNAYDVAMREVVEKLKAINAGGAEDFLNDIRLKIGLISPEELEAAKAKVEAAQTAAEEVDVSIDDLGLSVKKNTTRIRAKWGINFSEGGCYGIQDSRGKSGSLFKAKDELKDRFNAKYYNGRNAGEEFEGSWWLVSSSNNIEDVLSVIKSHA